MTSKGDIYRRKQSIIDTALQNDLVAELFTRHYNLFNTLDQSLVTDVYLILTRVYKPELDFVTEFKRLYRNLKLEYQEKTRLLNYNLTSFDDAVSTKTEDVEETI